MIILQGVRKTIIKQEGNVIIWNEQGLHFWRKTSSTHVIKPFHMLALAFIERSFAELKTWLALILIVLLGNKH